MIKIPVKLDKNIIEHINNSFNNAKQNVGHEESIYVLSRIDDVIKLLTSSPVRWKIQLASRAKLLTRIYKDHFGNEQPDCIGNFNLDSDLCLECGENSVTIWRYVLCREKVSSSNSKKKDCLTKNRDEARRVLLAGLFYLCNPFDIIPDFTPGTGFMDDAYVINYCIGFLEKKCPDLLEQYV